MSSDGKTATGGPRPQFGSAKELKPVVVKFNPNSAKKGDVIAHVVLQED